MTVWLVIFFIQKLFSPFVFLWRLLLRPQKIFALFFGGWISHKNQHPPKNFFIFFATEYTVFFLCHSEFSSESFSFTSRPLQWLLKQVQDDELWGPWAGGYRSGFTDGCLPHTQQTLHHLERGRSYHTKLPHIFTWEIKTKFAK